MNRVGRTACYLVIGVAANALVAWSCWRPVSALHLVEAGDGPCGAPRDWLPAETVHEGRALGVTVVTAQGRPGGPPGPLALQQKDRIGFPWRTFSRSFREYEKGDQLGMVISKLSTAATPGPVSRLANLPVRPELPGFVLGAAFYGLLAGAGGAAIRGVKAKRRRRGGQCARCGGSPGGPAEGAACPACGATRS